MSPLSQTDAQQLPGATLHSSDGTRIGKVADVYVDDETQQAEWAVVHTGLFGARESFVPLAQAELRGTDVYVPYSKDQVKEAPNAVPDGDLAAEEEARLYAHYGLGDSGAGGQVPAAATDDAMTRSEERLQVGVVKRPSETVRLRKRIVTENVSTTVPLERERATVTREPITEANRDAAVAGPELTEDEHEVVLTEERPVVSKETVPVERVRLAKDQVTEEETVSDEVRKERIEVEDPGGRDR